MFTSDDKMKTFQLPYMSEYSVFQPPVVVLQDFYLSRLYLSQSDKTKLRRNLFRFAYS